MWSVQHVTEYLALKQTLPDMKQYIHKRNNLTATNVNRNSHKRLTTSVMSILFIGDLGNSLVTYVVNVSPGREGETYIFITPTIQAI